MISKFTKPGTKVVCIDNDPANWPSQVKPQYRYMIDQICEEGSAELGALFTVSMIQEEECSSDGFSVSFFEMDGHYSLSCFRVASLPSCLLACLDAAPILEDA